MNVVDEHDWLKVSSSLSGYWACTRCGKFATGGSHDGGEYFPGRGEQAEFFLCHGRSVELEVDSEGVARAVRVRTAR